MLSCLSSHCHVRKRTSFGFFTWQTIVGVWAGGVLHSVIVVYVASVGVYLLLSFD